MKVYVILTGYDYETSDVEAVFDSQKKALEYVEGRKAGDFADGMSFHTGFDFMVIEEREVR